MAQAPTRRRPAGAGGLSRSRRLLVVRNARAGGGAGAHLSDEALESLESKGWGVRVASPRDVRRHVRRVAVEFDRIVASGGDGTFSAVAGGLYESGARVPLGLVPSGTGNDFAAALGLPEDPDEALAIALRGRVHAVDAGVANGRLFLNAVTAGAAAEVSRRTGARAKAWLGRFAYVLTALSQPGAFEPFAGRITGRGFDFSGPMQFFAVANGRRVGGGSLVTPTATLDDGLLDVVILPATTARRLAGALRALRTGADHPALVRFRAPAVRAELVDRIAVNRDGEPMQARSLELRSVRRAMLVPLPPRTGAATRTALGVEGLRPGA